MAAATVVSVACGSTTQVTPGVAQAELISSDLSRSVPAAHAPTAQAASALRTFGYELINRNPHLLEDGNLVLSPASIGTAFAMARAGAGGKTAEQIDAGLHFPTRGLGDAYNDLTAAWTSHSGAKDAPELSIANAVFAQRDLEINPTYLNALAHDYGAGVRTVNFSDDSAADQINAWAEAQTHGRIDKIAGVIDPATLLLLANAVYLKATWKRQFLADLTRTAPFHRADGTVVRPETMSYEGPESFGYATGDGWSAVRLPYVGDELVMWVLLPAAHVGDPVDLLDPEVIAAAMDQARTQRVDLQLPKWDFQSDLSLTGTLQGLGMRAPFDADADFSGISPVRLHISDVVHRADITVDETGTEAAAVTGVFIAAGGPPPPDAVMHVDHPFAFVILHEPTGAPLFEGVVGDPTATQ